MRFRWLDVAVSWSVLQLFACGTPEFQTANQSSSTGGSTGGDSSGGMGGETDTGGASSGGASSGGTTTGGASTGGESTGGRNTGGTSSGGTNSGGTDTGGTDTGGSGGANTGGTSSGGTGGMAEPPIPTEGLLLWLRADAGVTASEGKVSAWENQALPGGAGVQGASTWSPELAETGLNGKPAIDFDGVDDFLRLPEGAADFSAGLSTFIVLEEDTVDYCAAYLEFSNGSEKDDFFFGQAANHLQYEVTESFTMGAGSLILGAPQLVTMMQDPEGRVQIRRNSAEDGSATFGLPATMTRTENFIGRSLYTNCQLFDGRISEILVYNRRVGDDEVERLETYLQERWL
jgi:hypothetical protein